ncbi:ParB/RepB/Spo0J family partition protein [Pseudaeromonas sharmana]|uniref:Probable chromosome-partitioning protein ParB n=1 Tax=Pseudaeromonas sharmana TaxID=328412 RepID=A0ABV8CLG9_9GAMM
MTPKKRGLGKGLEALLGTSTAARQKQLLNDMRDEQALDHDQHGELRQLPLNTLQPGKYQPRKDMSQEALEELASSIRAQGVIQPIVVRKVAEQRYEIIAGERRWRASQLAKLETVPCLVKDVEDNAAVAIALIENIQREDLNAIEEAAALQRLMMEFELTHQQVAEAVGKSRSAVSNLLRLNQLNEDVKRLVEHGDLEMGHARALLALDGAVQTELARQVAQKAMTVRETERLVQKLLHPKPPVADKPQSPTLQHWEQAVASRLGMATRIVTSGQDKGKITVSFENKDQLQQLLKCFGLQ